MPRKKQGPRRLDEEEQRAANYVMGETDCDTENNVNINRELTNQLETAPAEALDDIVRAAGGDIDQETPNNDAGSSGANRVYNVIFDDDDDYNSEEDEDFVPQEDAKPKKPPAKKKAKVSVPKEVEEPVISEIDKELESLWGDAEASRK